MNTANNVGFVALLASHQEAVGCEVHRASADAGTLIVLTALVVIDAGYATYSLEMTKTSRNVYCSVVS